VAYREFNLVKLWVMMGTLVDEQKIPMAYARFTMNNNPYYTDEAGFFSLEETVDEHAQIDLEGEEFFCKMDTPPLHKDEAFIDLGALDCVKKPGSPP
jgi:hypothetical protein